MKDIIGMLIGPVSGLIGVIIGLRWEAKKYKQLRNEWYRTYDPTIVGRSPVGRFGNRNWTDRGLSR